MIIRPREERQIALRVKYDCKPIWPSIKSAMGIDATGCATAVMLCEAAAVNGGEVSYSRSHQYYSARDCHPLLTYRKVVRAVDQLDHGKWIKHSRQVPGGRGWQSAMSATSKLIGIMQPILDQYPRLPLVLPRNGVVLRDCEGRPIDLTATRHLARMNSTVHAINEAVTSVDVRSENGVALTSPMTRIFNIDPRLKRGGRWYAEGTSWQNIPKAARDRITIDGEEVVELDFKTLHPAMLYAEVGAMLPDDCYAIGSWARPLVKRAMLTLINAPNIHSSRFSIAHSDEMAAEVPDHHKWIPMAADLIADIKQAHRPIAHVFHSDAGSRLMMRDSELAKVVMQHLMRLNIVALPIHDSFLVPASKRDQLEMAMLEVAHAEGLQSVRITTA